MRVERETVYVSSTDVAEISKFPIRLCAALPCGCREDILKKYNDNKIVYAGGGQHQ
jgi:hypothetical protein